MTQKTKGEALTSYSNEVVLELEHLRPRVERFLLRRLSRREDAQDLAQEVFLRLLRFRHLDTVKEPAAYLYRIAFNVLSDFRMDEGRRIVAFDSNTAAQRAELLQGASAEEVVDNQSRHARVAMALARLPTMQRAVFVLAAQHGMKHSEIARELDISIHTVRKHLYRAVSACREQLVDR